MSERARYALACAAAILWIASFFLPAVKTGHGWEMGYAVAAMGWAGPLIGQFGWYANLIMIPGLGVLALGNPASSFDEMSKLGVALFLFWVNTLFWTDLQFDSGRRPILAYGSGYYAWMAAVLIGWLGLYIVARRGRPAEDRAQLESGINNSVEDRERAMRELEP